jgi:GTP-binding protein LepA
MLHMEIIQERLEREYDLDLITTAPSVVYELELKTGETIVVDNPSKLPDVSSVDRHPRADRHRDHSGAAGAPGQRHHPVHREARRAARHAVPRQPGAGAYDMPMNEVVLDFFDRSSPPAAAMLRWTTISIATSRPTWSSWTC